MSQPHVATQIRTISEQPTPTPAAQFHRVVAALEDKYPDAAEHLDARYELLALTAYLR